MLEPLFGERVVMIKNDKLESVVDFVFGLLVLTVLLTIILMLSGCGTKITAGEVYDKYYEPARTYMIMMPIYHNINKTSFVTYIPMFFDDDEDWVVCIKATVDGKTCTRRFYVPETVYNSISVGDWIDLYDLTPDGYSFNDADRELTDNERSEYEASRS